MSPPRLTVAAACGVGVLAQLLGPAATTDEPCTQTELVEVPVALKDLPIGTRVTADNARACFGCRQLPRAAVPPTTGFDVNELSDRRTLRPIRRGEVVLSGDMSNSTCRLPGRSEDVLATVPVALDQISRELSRSGNRVLILAEGTPASGQTQIAVPVSPEAVLVHSVSDDTGEARRHLSFVVTPEQAILLAIAREGGLTLRIRPLPCGGWVARGDESAEHLTVFPTVEAAYDHLASALTGQ